MTQKVVFLSGVRTAIGGFGGSLKDIPATTLAASVTREAVARATLEPERGLEAERHDQDDNPAKVSHAYLRLQPT